MNREELKEDAKKAGRWAWLHFSDDWFENLVLIAVAVSLTLLIVKCAP